MSKDATGATQALKAAVAAIYFDDSSDYLSALWSVVRALDPKMAELLESDDHEAFIRLHPECAVTGTIEDNDEH